MKSKKSHIVNKEQTSPHQNLLELGWSPFFEEQLEPIECAAPPARITGVRKGSFIVNFGNRELLATLAGSLIHNLAAPHLAVGDWVLVKNSVITTLLCRKNVLTRKAAGGKNRKESEPSTTDQVIAANLDKVFIVCGLDRDYNLRRIERYLTMVYTCGIAPEIILTKADVHHAPDICMNEVTSIAFGVPIHVVAIHDDHSLSALRSALYPGETAALIGSSGAGKSTLINRLCGEKIQATSGVSSSHGKGRHTTTSRDLIILPSGGMVVDNPGIREIGLASGYSAQDSTFPEIEELSRSCKFQDCSHTHEPGCGVLLAVSTGEISSSRLESYRKLNREMEYLSQRQSKSADRLEKEQWKNISQKIKHMKKNRK